MLKYGIKIEKEYLKSQKIEYVLDHFILFKINKKIKSENKDIEIKLKIDLAIVEDNSKEEIYLFYQV